MNSKRLHSLYRVQLEWPAKAEAFTFKISVVKSVCECALFYVSEVYNRLRPEDMFNQQGNFRATEKVRMVNCTSSTQQLMNC